MTSDLSQGMVFVLTADVDRQFPDLAQYLERGQFSVEEGPATAGACDAALDDQASLRIGRLNPMTIERFVHLVCQLRAEVELCIYGRRIPSGAHDVGTNSRAAQQGQRIHNDGLSRPRFAGQNIETGIEFDRNVVE